MANLCPFLALELNFWARKPSHSWIAKWGMRTPDVFMKTFYASACDLFGTTACLGI
jgi:hypothetical protein